MEKWKQIEGYEDYLISNKGRVYSVKRKRILKETKCTRGYVQVHLCKDGKAKNSPIHRLVALAFIDNPDNKRQVNHIDGNKKNNDVSNLEWCTNQENQIHARKIGLRK